MTGLQLRRILAGVAVAVLTVGGVAIIGIDTRTPAQADTAPDSPTTAVFRKAYTSVELPLPGGASTNTVVSMSVPAGTWLVQSKANAVNWGPGDFVRCGTFVNYSQQVGVGSTVHVGTHPGNGATHVGLLSTLGVLRTASEAFVTLQCSHDAGAAYGAVYVEDAALLAIRQGAIDG
jgi:hypothetical protein